MNLWQRISGLFTRSVNITPELRAAIDFALDNGGWTGGDSAMKCTGIAACVRVLSETVGQVPCKVYRRDPNNPDSREEAREHPLYDLLTESPNRDQTAFEWRERIVTDNCFYRGFFAQIVTDMKDNVRELIPLESRDVEPEMREDQIVYKHTPTGRVFSQREILYIPLMPSGLKGRALVDIAASAARLSINAEEFAQRFFKEGVSSSMMIRLREQVDVAKSREVAAYLREMYAGIKNAHAPFVAPGGVEEVKHIEIDFEKRQLLETRKFELENIARVFRVPMHLIGVLDRATFSNIEHQSIEFATYTMAPWFKRIEQRLNKSLVGPRENVFIEFDMASLLRGDYVSTVDALTRQINGAILTPNEARKKLNLPPMPGGDSLMIQGATVPLESAGSLRNAA